MKIDKNLIVGILSILITTVFGVWGIIYSTNAEIEKKEQSNKELITDIQELVYNNKTIDCHDIMTLIQGKEIKNNIEYPYSIKELLIQCQENFYSTKYLSLDNRKILVERIDSLRMLEGDCLKYSKDSKAQTFFSNWNFMIIFSIISLIVSMLILINLITRIREKIKQDYSTKFNEYEEQMPKYSSEGLKYETDIEKLFNNLGIKILKKEKDYGVDFLVKINDKKYIVETKFVKQNVTLSTLRHLFEIVNKSGLDLILISNRILNFETFNALSDFNKRTNIGKIYFVSGLTPEQLEKEIRKITNA